MKKQLVAEIAVRYLPSSSMADRLYRLFPAQPDTLEALVFALNSDADFSLLSHESRAGKDSFLVTTPRFRVRFFPDRNDRSTVILTGAEANRPDRWASDRKTGAACRITWTTTAVYANTTRDAILEEVRTTSDASIRATPFWEFWSDLLNGEQETVNDLRSFPGWAYRSRRQGIMGEIEFECDDAEDIFMRCSGGFLVSQTHTEGRADDRSRFALFQAIPGRAAGRLSGVAREKNIIAELPKQGIIQLDWISAAAELKRRRTTLDRLLTGRAAFSGLKDMLPNGPTEIRDTIPFTAILDKPYNEDQQDAIAKALVDNTVTCILGPPGTGKTSVIAEIAMQMTNQGKRVLISSQTNLAVDNALERLANQPGIFPVRLGRIEAVKLDPQLHIDMASKRYKEQLLSRSDAAEQRLLSQVEGSDDLPTEEELENWIQEWKSLARVQVQTRALQIDLQLKGSRHDQARAAKHDATTRVGDVCAQAGLVESQVSSFLTVVHKLTEQQIDVEALGMERLRIRKVLARKPVVDALMLQADQLALLGKTARATDLDITRYTKRLGKSASRKAELEEAKRFNDVLQRKRAKAGFWAGLWSEITESPKDLAPLERELATARRLEREAEAALPSLRARLVKERKQEDAETAAWNRSYRNVFGTSSTSSLSTEAAELKSLVELGAALEAARGTAYLDSLQHSTPVAEAHSRWKQAEVRATKAEVALRDVAGRLASASEELARHSDPSCDIQRVMDYLGLSDQDLSDETFVTLRQHLRSRHALLRSIPPIQEALRLYRERLKQPTLDLQQAVIAEADVVGATCSGIAGAKDFDADFDCVIVDEAGRTNPLELVMAIVRGKSIVLVGDHKQLLPFVSDAVRSEVTGPDREYLETSIFETIYKSSKNFGRTAALHKQYRMAPPICDIVTSISYRDTPLLTAGLALERVPGTSNLRSVHWVRPLGSRNRAVTKGTGLLNEAETEAAVMVLKRLRDMRISAPAKETPYCVGMISMYKQQAYAIERELAAFRVAGVFEIEVGTVDSFQGREMDAVILTFSETNPKIRRFFYDRRRLNVALSRAKEHLIVVGSLDRIGGQPMAFDDQPNALYELRLSIERAIAAGLASKEDFDA